MTPHAAKSELIRGYKNMLTLGLRMKQPDLGFFIDNFVLYIHSLDDEQVLATYGDFCDFLSEQPGG